MRIGCAALLPKISDSSDCLTIIACDQAGRSVFALDVQRFGSTRIPEQKACHPLSFTVLAQRRQDFRHGLGTKGPAQQFDHCSRLHRLALEGVADGHHPEFMLGLQLQNLQEHFRTDETEFVQHQNVGPADPNFSISDAIDEYGQRQALLFGNSGANQIVALAPRQRGPPHTSRLARGLVPALARGEVPALAVPSRNQWAEQCGLTGPRYTDRNRKPSALPQSTHDNKLRTSVLRALEIQA